MCGISGIWNSIDRELIKEMMDSMVHRGPDAGGRADREHGTLGHRRLSIMDPRGGNQPIYTASRDRAIIGNGEFYNYPTLRPQLAERHDLRTSSDTEAALHLFEENGVETAGSLDGMFAFAIADKDELYLARDPIGIKPLYYGRKGDGFVFASELKALAGRAEDVKEFPAGTWYSSKTGFHQYYEVPDLPVQAMTESDAVKLVRETIDRCVTKRLMSDVELGAFLSGGLDSSLIAALARPHLDKMHTFSVGIDGSADLEAARLVSRHLDTIHHEYVFTVDEVTKLLPEIIFYLESFDQDLVRSAVPCYFCSRMAAEHVKVILTGEGADELFAGYTYYKDLPSEAVLHNELRRSVSSLHNINLQRVDRMTMAHSIEGRVPFLDLDMITVGQRIPAAYKLRKDRHGRPVEKWVLRKAAEDLLPPEIVWRGKEQFDEGSGAVDVVGKAVERWLTPEQASSYQQEHPADELRSLEECVYHKLLVEAYDGCPTVLDNVGRWAARPELEAAVAAVSN